jgi:hypothetical protein
MAAKRMAAIDADGNIDNVILIEDGADWTPPGRCSLVDDADEAKAEPGGYYRAGAFEGALRLVEPSALSLEAQLEALRADIEALRQAENR